MPKNQSEYDKYINNNSYKPKLKIIHFGDKRYQHYKDKLKNYSYLDHRDRDRKKNYLARSKGIKNKNGELTYNNKLSPNYWSRNILW